MAIARFLKQFQSPLFYPSEMMGFEPLPWLTYPEALGLMAHAKDLK